jgi:hypothetical protein
MKEEHQQILEIITQYLNENQSQRFGQALTNLKIIGFADEKQPGKHQYLLRDIYNDTDSEILIRMNSIKNNG